MTLLEFEVPFLARIRERWFSAFVQARFARTLKECFLPLVEREFWQTDPFYEKTPERPDA